MWQVTSDSASTTSVTRRAPSGLQTSYSQLRLSSDNRRYFPTSGLVSVTCEASIIEPTPASVTPQSKAGDAHKASESVPTVNAGRKISVPIIKEHVPTPAAAATGNVHPVKNLIMRTDISVYGNLFNLT